MGSYRGLGLSAILEEFRMRQCVQEGSIVIQRPLPETRELMIQFHLVLKETAYY